MFNRDFSGLKDKFVLVVGADGGIGSNLIFELENIGAKVWKTTRNVEKRSLTRFYLDLSDDLTVRSFLPIHFDIVFICAAITSIERCKTEPDLTKKVNVINTVSLAARFVEENTFVIFLSSNAVFNGEAPFMKVKGFVDPQTNYGKQKAEAESLLIALNGNVAIVRLNKIITPQLSLLHSWINNLKAGKLIHPFYDMVMAPISLKYATEVLLVVAQERINGITQVSANNDISYKSVAEYIANSIGADENLIQPISYKDLGIEFSPQYTTFDCSELTNIGFEVPLPLSAFDEFLNLL